MLVYIWNLLTNTKISVKLAGVFSALYDIINGVLQGCSISPILFLIMTNDLADRLFNAGCLLFADDSVIYKTGNNLSYTMEVLQNVLDAIRDWCDAWGFKLSTTKSAAVLFRNPSPSALPQPLKYASVNLPFVDEYKYLGVVSTAT